METIVKKELLYDGMFYDVTKWVKRHPGGKIIEIYTSPGEDSTIAVQQFHQKSTKKVMSIMNSLPKRPATAEELNIDNEKSRRHSALTKDFLELHQELQAEGLFKPDFFHVISISEVLFLSFIGGYLFLSSPQFSIARIAGICLSALAVGRSGWIMHETGHHSFTGIPKLDRLIQSLIQGGLFGLSGNYWNYGHSRHHAMPQHIKHDADLQFLPTLAFHRKLVKNPEQGKGFILQNQKWLVVLMDIMVITSYWKFYFQPRYCLHKKNYFDLFCMAMHYVVVFGFFRVGLWEFLFGSYLISSYIMFNTFLSHSYLPIAEEPTHWVEYSLTHTTNIRSSWLTDYWMGYMTYQIEHHLFPAMPQFKNHLCRDRVKALAKKHNLQYNLYSYSEAVVKTFENLGAVSKELALQ